MSKRYLEFSNGTKIVFPDNQESKKVNLEASSPVPDQDLGDGFSIKDGKMVISIDSGGGSIGRSPSIEESIGFAAKQLDKIRSIFYTKDSGAKIGDEVKFKK